MADKLALTQNREARDRAQRHAEKVLQRYVTAGSALYAMQTEIDKAYLAGYRSRIAEERRERKS